MGGNPLCAAAGAACMKLIAEQDLVERAAKKGDAVMGMLTDAAISCVKEVRGKGLMIGIEVDKSAKDIFAAGIERGLLVCLAGEHVVRLAPPLIIEDDLLEEGMEILIDILNS